MNNKLNVKISWALYDWANSAWSAIIITFIFSRYFVDVMMTDKDLATLYWTWTIGISSLVAALLSPILGSISDQSNKSKLLLILSTLIYAFIAISLWFVFPNSMDIFLILLLIFIGKNLILTLLISVYFLPTILFIIPIFVILVSYKLDDTILSLVLPYTAFILPFVIWILKTFIDKLPLEIEEAARIDGCTIFQLLTKIIFPLLKPGIIAVFIFSFILSWVEFLTPLIFTNNLKMSTVALGLFRSTIDIKIGQQAAAAIITLIPVVVLMIFFQKYITRVILTGSEK
ncbi:ABC transporter permease subunit [Alphaproteobacteria bacterium]|nr:ABC transporter permease subunit [Alphaproteobacteria bacterium]